MKKNMYLHNQSSKWANNKISKLYKKTLWESKFW